MRSALIAGLLALAPVVSGQVFRTPAPADRITPNARAFESFNRAHGNRWRVQWNPITGTPHRISGSYIEVAQPTRNTAGRIALDFIRQNRELLGVDPAALVLAKADFNPRATWYVDFHQVYSGVPVEGGSVRVILRGRRITSFGSDFFPGINVPSQPAVTRAQAVAKAFRDLNIEGKPARVDLIVFPQTRMRPLRYHLAWAIIMPVIYRPNIEHTAPVERQRERAPRQEIVPVQFRYVIDAITGEIVDRSNLMISTTLTGHVTGMARPFVPTDPPATVDIAHMTVSVTQGGTTTTATTDASGMYSFPALGTGPATVQTHLTGPHTAVHNNETPDPDATHTATVTPSTTHDWNWSTDDPSPSDVEEHAFYHADRIRQWYLRGAPFNVAPDPDPMDVFVRDGAYCNAYAGFDGVHFGSGVPGSCEDFALCSDIFYHEYTHRIVDRVYTDAGVVLPYGGQSGAMNEAWADYFSCSLTNDPSHGEGCYSGRNIDTPNHRYPDNIVGEVHEDGIIFSGALWDTRAALGATYVDAMALRAMKHAAIDFDDYLEAVLEEDDDPSFNASPGADNNLANGTPNIDTICHNYYDLHGIFDPACAGHTQTPVAIITSPSMTDLDLFGPGTTSITVVGTAASSSQPFQSFTLDYASMASPTTFVTAGITLTGGGTAAVSNATLGTFDVSALPDGFYLLRLTVTDTAGGTARVTANVNLDRSFMPGWPQATASYFLNSAAVADLDPAVAGMEIAARDVWGSLNVWHKDGTQVPGWPQWAGVSFGAPAVADLDGNGTLEIVTTDEYSGTVYAFHQDGTAVAGWPNACGSAVWGAAALADLDGDGKLEVIVGSDSNQICAWHADGTVVAGWPVGTHLPVLIGASIRSSPAVADLDKDGVPEIVAGANDGNVYALRANGTPMPGWPKSVASEVSASPALGDLDGDGNLEIVVGTYDQKVYVWHHTGVAVAGWPQTMNQFVRWPGSVVLADLDGDGVLEVIVMSNDDSINVWHGDGTMLTGWPPAAAALSGYEWFVSTPAIGDIDGDGKRDAIVKGTYGSVGNVLLSKIYAFHDDATAVAGWPKILTYFYGPPPVLADVDLDGNVDVVQPSKGILIWKLTGAYRSYPTDWLTARHDNRRSGAVSSTVDQQQPAYDVTGYTIAIGGNSQQKLAQVVTPSVSGSLTEVRVPVGCSVGSDLILSIEGVTGGKPNGTVLATQTYSVPGWAGFRRLVLSAPPAVTAGTPFAFILNSTGSCAINHGPAGNPYAGGNMYFDSRPNAAGVWVCQCDFAGTPFDLPFFTYVGR